MIHRRFGHVISSLFLGLGGLIAPAQASTLEPLSLAKLAARSDVILKARVVGHESRWVGDARARIVTWYQLAPIDVVTGALAAEERTRGAVLLAVLGGAVGDVAQHVFGAPSFTEGDVIVACLGPADGPGGARQLIGMSQGVFWSDAEGRLSPAREHHAPLGEPVPALRWEEFLQQTRRVP